MNRQLKFSISGRVQGVGFRAATRRRARQLGLTGWVKNEPDGTVKVVAEGPEEKLDQLKNWLEEGTPLAAVTDLEVQSGELEKFAEFQIIR